MDRTDSSIALGVFDTRDQAQAAVDDLRQLGFANAQIGVAVRLSEGGKAAPPEAGDSVAAGAVGGGALGALAGIAVAAGVVPPLGPVVAGGALAGILASAAAGAAVGGVVGALIDLGLTEEEAAFYERELAAGRTLVTVRAGGRRDEAQAILRRHGARDTVPRRPIDVPPVPVL